MGAAQKFESMTATFWHEAEKIQFPPERATQIVNLNRGPVFSTDAYVTWMRWYHALPGDPISNLTVSDLRDRFVIGAEAWQQSQQALDEIWSWMTEPAIYDETAQAVRAADWQAYRQAAMGELERETPLAHLDASISLAKKGLVRELMVDTMHSTGQASAEHALLLAELEAGGIARLAERAGARDLAGAAGWAIGGTVALAGCAVVAGALTLPVSATLLGVAAAGYAGYCLTEMNTVTGWWGKPGP